MNLLKPENLSLAIGMNNSNPDYGLGLERIFKDDMILPEALSFLNRFFKIKIWFNIPVLINVQKSVKKTQTEDGITTWTRSSGFKKNTCHVFHNLIYSTKLQNNTKLIYGIRKNIRLCYHFDWLDNIIKYELVISKKGNPKGIRPSQFSCYKDFKRKFDPLFITETEILKLWNGTSNQHGNKYTPKDFRCIGPQGRKIMERFLKNFKGINNSGGPGYNKSSHGNYTLLSENYNSWRSPGRNITIEHNSFCEYVHYSSERHGCGNGRYGLIANKNTYLWLEDD